MNDITNEPLSPDEEREWDAIDKTVKNFMNRNAASWARTNARSDLFPELVRAVEEYRVNRLMAGVPDYLMIDLNDLLARARRLLERQT